MSRDFGLPLSVRIPLVDRKKKYYHDYILQNVPFRLFDMKRQSIRILIAIAISSLIAVFPAYSRYIDLSDLSPSSVNLAFESPDQDDQISDQQHESGTPLISHVSAQVPQKSHLFDSLSSLLITESFDNQKISVLRC